MPQQTTTMTVTFVVNDRLTISTTQLPAATVGTAYSFQLVAQGGVAPYAWSTTGLPAGLSCSAAGLISGTPTGSGSSTVVITVVDSGN